jgi:hypothetical protein
MDHRVALEILRLDRLEKRAQAYRESGMRSGNLRRCRRAADLELAAHARSMAIVGDEVSTYRRD